MITTALKPDEASQGACNLSTEAVRKRLRIKLIGRSYQGFSPS